MITRRGGYVQDVGMSGALALVVETEAQVALNVQGKNAKKIIEVGYEHPHQLPN